MSLPKETQERIKADAKSERIKWDGKIKEGVTEESRHHFLEGIHDGYIAGASAENERAQKLVEALEKIANNTAWQNWQAQEIAKSALQQWNAGKEVAYKGSVITEPAPGISLGCISPEARELLDTIMEQWEKHYASMKEMHGDAMPETTFYGFAYWLVRWSGLVQPAGKEAEEPKPEGWPWICEHCGKQDCESDHK